MQTQTQVYKQYCDKVEDIVNPQVSCSKQSAPLGGNTKAALDIVYRIVYRTIFTEFSPRHPLCASRRMHLYIMLLDEVFERPD